MRSAKIKSFPDWKPNLRIYNSQCTHSAHERRPSLSRSGI